MDKGVGPRVSTVPLNARDALVQLLGSLVRVGVYDIVAVCVWARVRVRVRVRVWVRVRVRVRVRARARAISPRAAWRGLAAR